MKVLSTTGLSKLIQLIKDAVYTKQDKLISGSTIKTINSSSILGSGNISITGLPSQSSNSGKYLTTNGTSASWSVVNSSIDAGQYTAGTGTYAITRYSIIAQKPNMTWEKITNTSSTYSTGTSKTINTNGFLLNQLRYYSYTSTVSSGSKISSNYCYEKCSSIDMRYSTNCGSSPSWSLGDYIYLVGTIGVDGLFYFDTTTWWTKTLPSTNDGKLYIRIGLVLSASSYNITFFSDRPIFYHNGTKLCEYKIADNKQDTLVSGTNIKTINNSSILGSGNIDVVSTTITYWTDDDQNNNSTPSLGGDPEPHD